MLNENDEKKIQVITHDENGMVLSKDEVVGDFGDKFTT
jgi:hypothetical protein